MPFSYHIQAAPKPSARLTIEYKEQLMGELQSDIIYELGGGLLDLEGVSIKVPSGGLNLKGQGNGTTTLTCSEDNYSMFVDPDVGYGGNLNLVDMQITTSGSNSKVFDLDNQGNFDAVECLNVNFVGCTSLGELTAYRQGLYSNVAIIGGNDGLVMSGTWAGGFAAVTSIGIMIPAGYTLFKEGTGLSIAGSFRTDMNWLSSDLSAIFCDFTESDLVLDGGMLFDDFRAPLGSNPVPNIPGSSVKALYSNCQGLGNTYTGAYCEWTTSTPTTIAAVDTLTKVAGTTLCLDEYWMSMPTDNEIQYDSDIPVEAIVQGSITLDGSGNDQVVCQFRKWEAGISSYIDVGTEVQATLAGNSSNTRAENVPIFFNVTLHKDDRIELWAKNTSDDSDFSIVAGSHYSITKRAS